MNCSNMFVEEQLEDIYEYVVVVLEEDIIEEEVEIEESESQMKVRATLVDHVIDCGFTMEEAGR